MAGSRRMTREENGTWYTITPYVAQNIRTLVHREDLTLKMLAEFCGIPNSTLGNVMQVPARCQTTACLPTIAAVLRTTAEWLQEDHDD